jgi:hypothetical protein
MVSIYLLAAAALATAPTQRSPMRETKVRETKIMTARVVILERVDTKPLDRAAKNKGHDRHVKRRGDLLITEYY